MQFAGEDAGLYIGSFLISIKIVVLESWNWGEDVSTKIGPPVVDDAGDTGDRGEESILKGKDFMVGRRPKKVKFNYVFLSTKGRLIFFSVWMNWVNAKE